MAEANKNIGHFQAFAEEWFSKHQRVLLWLCNAPAIKLWFRYVLRIHEFDCPRKTKITQLGPNRFSWGDKKVLETCEQYRKHFHGYELRSWNKAHKKSNCPGWHMAQQRTTDFRTHDKFSKRIYFAFAPMWWAFHAWDWLVADRFVPAWSFGFSTLTQYPATITSSNPVDGYAFGGNSYTWSLVVGANGGGLYNGSDGYDSYCSGWSTASDGRYVTVIRSKFCFDTSSLTSAATISTAALSLYGTAKTKDASNTPNIDIYIAGGSTSANANSDFQNAGSTSQTGSPMVYASWSTAGYNAFAFNSTGIGNVSLTGISKFGARNQNFDVTGTAPVDVISGSDYFSCSYSGHYGTTQDPKLVVTYSSVTTNTVTSTAKARVKVLDNTKTVTAKARVKQLSNDKTATAKSRIKVSGNNKTVQAKARVKVLGNDKAVTARARVKQLGTTKTITAKARVKQSGTTKTVTAKARVKVLGNNKTVGAKARVKQLGNNKTVTAKARVKVVGNTGWCKEFLITPDAINDDLSFDLTHPDVPAEFWDHVNSDGGDIRVYAEDDVTQLPREVSGFDFAGHKGIIYIGGLTAHSAIYIWCGNPSATEPAANSTYGSRAVWPTGTAVYHMNDLTSSTILDSKGNYNGTKFGGADAPVEVDALIGKGQSFNGVSSNGGVSTSDNIDNSQPFSFIVLVNQRTLANLNDNGLVSKHTHNTGTNDKGARLTLSVSGKLVFLVGQSSSGDTEQTVSSNANWPFNTNALAAGIYDGTNLIQYANGVIKSVVCNIVPVNLATSLRIGNTHHSNGTLDGIIDEVRVCWYAVTTTYLDTMRSNLLSPATFWTVGPLLDRDGSGHTRAKARIKVNQAKTVTAKANITATPTKQINARADIQKYDITKSISAKANVVYLVGKNIQTKARIKTLGEQTLDAKARVKRSGESTITAQAHVIGHLEKTATAKARVRVLNNTRAINAHARVKQPDQTKTVTAKAYVKSTQTKTEQTKARIRQLGTTKTATAKARVKNTLTRTVGAKARIWGARLGITEGTRATRGKFGTKNTSKIQEGRRNYGHIQGGKRLVKNG